MHQDIFDQLTNAVDGTYDQTQAEGKDEQSL